MNMLFFRNVIRNVIAAMKLVLMDGMLKEHHSGEIEKPFMLMLQQGLQEVSSKLYVVFLFM